MATFTLHVGEDDFAEEFAAIGGFAINVLTELAEINEDEDGGLIDKIVAAHGLNKWHMTVAPFLRQLAEALETVEADHASE